MEKTVVIERLAILKEKAVNLQTRLKSIEESCKYADSDKFKWYKAEIDSVLVDLEVSFESVEKAVERTAALAAMGWFEGEEKGADFYIEEDFKIGTCSIKKKISKISDLFDMAIS